MIIKQENDNRHKYCFKPLNIQIYIIIKIRELLYKHVINWLI